MVAPIFGWKHPDGRRIRRSGWVEVPKKNTKSTMAGVFGLYLTGPDNEPGAEVYSAASEKDQARIVFDPAALMVERSPALASRYQVFRNTITYPKTGSFFRVISAAPKGKHGLNIHGGIIDEVHAHESRELIDTLDYGTASREQPLMLYITTAGEEDDESIYAEKHDYVISICEGRVDDPTFYGVVFAAEPEDDPFDERTWEKANPGLDISVDRDYLRSKAVEAATSPKKLKAFKRFHLNIRQSETVEKPIPLEKWDASVGPKVKELALSNELCFGGLSVSRSRDIGCFTLDFPCEANHRALWRFWLPRDWFDLVDDETKGAASKWRKQDALILTDGDVIDYDVIERQILDDAERFDLREIGFNRRGARQLAQRLEGHGITMVQMAPGLNLAPAMQEWERLVFKGAWHHGGNPVARHMVDKLVCRTDPAGNAWPDQGRSKWNVSGCMAAVMALDCATRNVDDEEAAELVSF